MSSQAGSSVIKRSIQSNGTLFLQDQSAQKKNKRTETTQEYTSAIYRKTQHTV